jgi:hypothetical protein
MSAKTSGWVGCGMLIDGHVGNRNKTQRGRDEMLLTFLSPTNQNPITLQTEIHVDEVGAGPATETYSRS